MEQLIREHSVNIEKGLTTIVGVINVESFDSKQVAATLTNNSITIKGENLIVVDLDIKSQNLIIKGNVNSFAYGKKQEHIPLFKKLFK